MDDMPIGDVEKGEQTNKTSNTSFGDGEEDKLSSSQPFVGSNGKKDLIWSGINLKLMEKKKGKENIKLNILKDVWGKAEAGKTTAIMGASGAGSKCACLSYIYALLVSSLTSQPFHHAQRQVSFKFSLGASPVKATSFRREKSTWAESGSIHAIENTASCLGMLPKKILSMRHLLLGKLSALVPSFVFLAPLPMRTLKSWSIRNSRPWV